MINAFLLFNQDCKKDNIFKTIVGIISADKSFLNIYNPENDSEYYVEDEVIKEWKKVLKNYVKNVV